VPIKPGLDNPDEPVFITGVFLYLSFLLETISEAFVMLEDWLVLSTSKEFTFSGKPGNYRGGMMKIKTTYNLALPISTGRHARFG
jgi:hypothetical protein